MHIFSVEILLFETFPGVWNVLVAEWRVGNLDSNENTVIKWGLDLVFEVRFVKRLLRTKKHIIMIFVCILFTKVYSPL